MTELVYIVSPSFSGSTLLTFLLGTHPDVGTVGELKATAMGDVEAYDCSCGERIRHCGFWRRITELLGRRGNSFDVGDFGTHFRARLDSLVDRSLRAPVQGPVFERARNVGLRVLPGGRRLLTRILERNRALIDAVLELQGASRFLDSSKDPVRLKYLSQSGYWNIKTIHIVRDGRGTSNSYLRHAATIEDATRQWRRELEECERQLSCLPAASWTRVHYEDLCRDVDGVLGKLFGFLGLDGSPATRDFRSTEHHILGNYMRLRSTREITLDEKWRGALTPEQLRAFDRIGGDLNRRYGYE